MGKQFIITGVDYEPDDLRGQLPIRGKLERQIRGNDRPDYWLATLDSPVFWRRDRRHVIQINHLVMVSHFEGTTISSDMDNLAVGIAYVIDESLLEDSNLSFEKCEYIAIGTVSTES